MRRLHRWMFAMCLGSMLAAAWPSAHVLAQPTPAAAPRPIVPGQDGPPVPRVRWIKYAIIGGLTGSALAAGYYGLSDKGLNSGQCKPMRCALPFLSVSGMLSGMFLAREIEAQRRALAPRVGATESYSSSMLELLALPTSYMVRDSILVAVGDSGAVLAPIGGNVSALDARTMLRQGRGLARLRAVDLTVDHRRLLMGSASAFYSAPISGGTVERLLPGAVSALAAGPRPEVWAVARGEWITVQRENGTRDSLRVGNTNALSWDARRNVWWAGTDSGLVALRDAANAAAGTLEIARRYETPAPVRAVAHGARWVAAALGEAGAIGWRDEAGLSVVPAPTVLRGSPRFVYDIAMKGDMLWLAAGSDGLVRMALEPEWRVLGSTRDRGYITGVRTGMGDEVWVTELGQQRVQKLEVRSK